MLPPLILTGGPAVGKSTTAGRLARARQCAAVVDVEDVRLMVVAGHAAPWQGEQGRAQQQLGVENACGLARHFLDHRIEVVIADMLTLATIAMYRRMLPHCLVVRLHVTPEEARRRAAARPAYLTDAEFDQLHIQDRGDPPPANRHLDVSRISVDEQVAAVAAPWR